jgi:predicted nucleic acid-binding Zn ribbon protein
VSDEPDPGPDAEPGPEPDAGPDAGENLGHDLTGLDLARSVAAAYRSSGPKRRAGSRPAPRPGETFFGRRRQTLFDGTASGAHPDERDPQLLDTTLSRLVVERGWRTDIAVHGVFSRWDQIVGSEVAEHCTPERYVDRELTVRADSTAWATQVRLLAAQVLVRLNAELGQGTVTRIHVEGPQAPSWRHGPRTVRGRGPRDTYG